MYHSKNYSFFLYIYIYIFFFIFFVNLTDTERTKCELLLTGIHVAEQLTSALAALYWLPVYFRVNIEII